MIPFDKKQKIKPLPGYPREETLRERIKSAWSSYPHRSEIRLFALATVVGILSGFGAVTFTYFLEFIWDSFYSDPSSGWRKISIFLIVPPAGGLIVGYMTEKFAREARGHGVPEVMESLTLNRGRMRLRVPLVKSIASGITIGTGGSAGREGPFAQIGAGIGSAIGQLLDLNDEEMRLLTTCGLSSGIAATFNAPLGGALFGFEIMLGVLEPLAIIPIILASVIATGVMTHFFGVHPMLELPVFKFTQPSQLILFFLLGVIGGILASGWVKGFYFIEGLFDRLEIPMEFKPAIGALGISLIAIAGAPEVMGTSFDTIEDIVKKRLSLLVLGGLLLAKALGTASTIGSGGSGGVFSPSLFLGGAMGAMFGIFMKNIGWIPSSDMGMFALVGMGTVFCGAAKAPITTTVILFEMTGEYSLLPPLIAANIISYTIAMLILEEEDIYISKLHKRGIWLKRGYVLDILDEIRVKEHMSTPVETLPASMSIEKAVEILIEKKHTGYPIVDKKGELVGMVTLWDIHNVFHDPSINPKTITLGDVFLTEVVTVLPDETMNQALEKMFKYKIGRLPVVKPKNPKKPIGIITRKNIIRAHELALFDKKIWAKIIRDRHMPKKRGKAKRLVIREEENEH